MKRWLVNLAAIVCLLLLVGTVVIYLRAFTSRDELHTTIFRHDCLIATFPHHLHVILADHPSVNAYITSLKCGLTQYPSRPKYLQPRLTSTGVYHEISIPFWLPLLFSAALPLWIGAKAWKHGRRKRAGLCPVCGYDLRATPERCPECGSHVS